jgi:chromosome segregation ATPase
MGRAALVERGDRSEQSSQAMITELIDRIAALLAGSERDLDSIERTLTDGYAHALNLEAERQRLERRLAEMAQDAHSGDPHAKTRELSQLAERLDGNADELQALRDRLGDLRRHASEIRAA